MQNNPKESTVADDFINQFMTEEESLSQTVEESVSTSNGGSLQEMLLEQQVVDALRNIYDPEIPVNIYDLGLIYNVEIDDGGVASIDMTLTSPGCPVAQTFPGTVECAVKCVDGINDAKVELVWDPPWTKERMTEDALLSLGLL